MEIFFRPSVIHGPQIVLDMRDYILAADTDAKIKESFVKHAMTWLTPEKVALHLLTNKVDLIDFIDLPRNEPDVEALLSSTAPIDKFYCTQTLQSPVLTRGTSEAWQAFKNNNMSCERLVGWVKNAIENKTIADSQDHHSDEQIAATDERVRGLINCAYYNH